LPSTNWSMHGVDLLSAHRKSKCYDAIGIEKKILLEQSPIRKLESCESRFLWKNWSYSHTTWKHLCEPIVVRVRQGGKPWSKRTILHRLPSPRDPCCIPNPWDG